MGSVHGERRRNRPQRLVHGTYTGGSPWGLLRMAILMPKAAPRLSRRTTCWRVGEAPVPSRVVGACFGTIIDGFVRFGGLPRPTVRRSATMTIPDRVTEGKCLASLRRQPTSFSAMTLTLCPTRLSRDPDRSDWSITGGAVLCQSLKRRSHQEQPRQTLSISSRASLAGTEGCTTNAK
jgi:hypothetical protein